MRYLYGQNFNKRGWGKPKHGSESSGQIYIYILWSETGLILFINDWCGGGTCILRCVSDVSVYPQCIAISKCDIVNDQIEKYKGSVKYQTLDDTIQTILTLSPGCVLI